MWRTGSRVDSIRSGTGAKRTAGRPPDCPGFRVRTQRVHNKSGSRRNSGNGLGMIGMSVQHAPEPSWSDAWIAVRDRLRLELGQGVFDTWIAPLSLIAAAEGVVRLASPNRLVRDYAAQHHGER